MKPSHFIRKQAQAGFTLIELVVVIVILGILAATALPRMFDMSGQARLAKMQAAVGSVRAASATTHASFLMNGGELGCTTCATGGGPKAGTLVTAENNNIPLFGGYPDVGGDAHLNVATVAANSGIVVASGLTGYELTTGTPAQGLALTISADVGHPLCSFTYTEATITEVAGVAQQNGPPIVPATTGSAVLLAPPVIGTANLLGATGVANCG